ncbi:MAG TPA: DNA-binding response regulator [Anaerolineaceae bacterium]|nr:DNA-binding response regulator [Anaerolineaceae bacterium]
MINILVVEDFPMIRQGVCKILNDMDGFQVIGESDNGVDGIKLTQELTPDVIVLDISMPGMDGIDTLRKLMDFSPRPKVVMLSIHADLALIQQSLELGALSYILKQSVTEELQDAIRAANRGSVYLSSEISHVLMKHKPKNPLDRLSPREREVVTLVVAGKSALEIAQKLKTSVKTIEKQRRDAMRKLEVENIASLVRVSMKLGLSEESKDSA